MNLETIIKRYDYFVSEKQVLINQSNHRLKEVEILGVEKDNHVKAKWVISEVSKLTQQKFKEKVESLVTMAITSIFERDFVFQLCLEYKRGKLECRPIIIEGGKYEREITEDMGGGMLPIIAVALRVALWSLEKPRSRNVIILDEPIKGSLGNDDLERTMQMFHKLSHGIKGGLQIIIVTHIKKLANLADKAFMVTYEKGKSIVKTFKKGELE